MYTWDSSIIFSILKCELSQEHCSRFISGEKTVFLLNFYVQLDFWVFVGKKVKLLGQLSSTDNCTIQDLMALIR